MKAVSVAEMRSAELSAIAAGAPGYVLMRRAGVEAAKLARLFLEKHHMRRVVCLAGGGNNGGDALAAAAELDRQGVPVRVILTVPPERLHDEAAFAFRDLSGAIDIAFRSEFDPEEFLPDELLLDGLLGIGFTGELRDTAAHCIAAINASHNPVIALDVPPGLNADSGEAATGGAVKADVTITFGGVKAGLLKNDGIKLSGILRYAPIGIATQKDASGVEVYSDSEARADLPRFDGEVYKNRRGRLLVAAGSMGYSGAAVLASTAALRAGAGLVELVTPVRPFAPLPAAVIVRLNGNLETLALADGVLAGSGWGNTPSHWPVLLELLRSDKFLVLDADALNLIAHRPDLWRRRSAPAVLTPHPGEAARLAAAFGVKSDGRPGLAVGLAAATGAVIVLKGPHTVVADPTGNHTLNLSGAATLATAGTGDVLAGVIAGLGVALGGDAARAARLGVFLHGRGGEYGSGGFISDDLPELVGQAASDLQFGFAGI
ncbi:MAG: NAD(P)H-hydrate dehydratase [Victivallaceae bacterium]|nr:NAD(P)H-hydrate dehydratase [Victivallaceae bacterium]